MIIFHDQENITKNEVERIKIISIRKESDESLKKQITFSMFTCYQKN